jgi:hypothetical protein
MPDWKEIVRQKLGRLPLHNGRRDEIIEELAQQLESAYEEALAQGITEQEALRRSLAQFKDWEKLRSEVFHSVEGTHLPVWEQNGFFSPRRLPVWIALALALLLVATPSFRQALVSIPVPGSEPTAWSSRAFSEKALRRIAQSGDKQKYARALAYVALHSPREDDLRAVHAAEKAIALDPQLTWISGHVCHASYLVPGYDPHPWIERLKAWDPQNAYPYLLEASANVHYWEPPWAKYSAAPASLRDALAAEPRWRGPMEKAFAAPRLDSYNEQAFALDRQVLQENGFDRPDILMINTWSQPLPDLQAIRLYAEFLLQVEGESAGKAGRPEEALAAYRTVARFGEKLQAANIHFEKVFANRLQQEAYEKMIPLLRRQGRAQEASLADAALAGLVQADPAKQVPSLDSARRSARIVLLSGLLAAVFAAATAGWLPFVLILKAKPDLSRALNRVASAFCVAPPLLLAACAALFLSYYPYARPIAQYSSMEDLRQTFGPFFINTFWTIDPLPSDVWLVRMFWPSIWGAFIALGSALALWLVARQRPHRPDAA